MIELMIIIVVIIGLIFLIIEIKDCGVNPSYDAWLKEDEATYHWSDDKHPNNKIHNYNDPIDFDVVEKVIKETFKKVGNKKNKK